MTDQATTQNELAQPLTEKDLNEVEWANPDNWGGPPLLSVYFSKKDKRVWVPTRARRLLTPNLAHDAGILWFVGIPILLIVVLGVVTVAILTRVPGL